MITIGLTGQTGAGKSTFADYLRRKYGFVHIDTDKISREVIKTKTAELAAMFGSDVLNPDGTPNRKMIAKKAFSSKENTDALNRIMHPAIMQTVEKMIADAEKNGAAGAVVDGAAENNRTGQPFRRRRGDAVKRSERRIFLYIQHGA